MKLAVFTFALLAWSTLASAQEPPDHTFYDIARQGSSPSNRRLWDMLESTDEERYERAVRDKMEEQEDRLERLERER